MGLNSGYILKSSLLYRASSPPRPTYGLLAWHYGKSLPSPENSLMKVRAMPKYCLTCQICGGKEDQAFFSLRPTDARGKCGIWCTNAGSGKRRNVLPLVKFISSFSEKISVLIPSIANEHICFFGDIFFLPCLCTNVLTKVVVGLGSL